MLGTHIQNRLFYFALLDRSGLWTPSTFVCVKLVQNHGAGLEKGQPMQRYSQIKVVAVWDGGGELDSKLASHILVAGNFRPMSVILCQIGPESRNWTRKGLADAEIFLN